ncbi:MAG: hypothetical protein M1823_005322 [Watsoniomyces obsoletus]|nr:MAG: hypothetical protein M1823_005322 [Watsoniomyces obsoletus]
MAFAESHLAPAVPMEETAVDDGIDIDNPTSQPVEIRPLTGMSAAVLRQACADVVNDWMGIGWASRGQCIMNENEARRAAAAAAGDQWPSRRPSTSAAKYVPAYAGTGFARTTTSRTASFTTGNGRRPSVRQLWRGSERGSSELTRQPSQQQQQQHRRNRMSTDFVYVQTKESEPSYYLIEPCPVASTRPSVDANRPSSRGARLFNTLMSLSSAESSNSAGATDPGHGQGHGQRWWRGGSLRRRKSNKEYPKVTLSKAAREEVAVEGVDLDRPLPALPRLSTWMASGEEWQAIGADVTNEQQTQEQAGAESTETDSPAVKKENEKQDRISPQSTNQSHPAEVITSPPEESNSSTTPTVTNSTPNITMAPTPENTNDDQKPTGVECGPETDQPLRTESRSQKLKRQLSRIMSPAIRHIQSVHQGHVQSNPHGGGHHPQSQSHQRQHNRVDRSGHRNGNGTENGSGNGTPQNRTNSQRKPPRDVGIYDHVILISPESSGTTVC